MAGGAEAGDRGGVAGAGVVGVRTDEQHSLRGLTPQQRKYETSDGDVRHVQAGSFVLVEDTHGKGHLSRHSAEAQTVIWISLPNGLALPPA